MSLYKDLFASCVGTTIAEITMLPVCTIKVNYQTNLAYKSLFETSKDIYKTRGIYGFYNASAFAIISQVTSVSSKYVLYEALKKYRGTKQTDYMDNIVNGCLSGIAGSILTHPFDVVKIYKQIGKSFVTELKLEGPKLLYRGYSKNFYKTIGLWSFLFPTYDLYKQYTPNLYVAALATSGTISCVLHPIDYLKTRHIANEKLWQGWNIINYYRGFGVGLLRTLPHFMIVMGVTEMIKQKF